MIFSGQYRSGLDRCGMVMASLCLLHCAVVPAIFLISPVIGMYQANSEWLHAPLALAALLLCLYATVLGKRRHRRLTPLLIGFLAALLLFLSLAEQMFGDFTEFLASVGAILAALAHLLNLRAAGGCSTVRPASIKCNSTSGHPH